MKAILLVSSLTIFCAACTTTPEVADRTRATEEQIESILSQPLDAEEYGESKRCLADSEYRNFTVLDNERILFEGRRGQQWLNTLRMPCIDLRDADALQMRSSFSTSRICDLDSFQPVDWFDQPWYRSRPWSPGYRWGSGMSCSLGKFQPVTDAQVEALKIALRQSR